jgi:hypothetical protein
MARPSKMSVQKRLRERKKAEAAELKREARRRPDAVEKPVGPQVAEAADLEGYGVGPAASRTR